MQKMKGNMFMTDLKTSHSMANTYKDLCGMSDKMVKRKNGTPAVDGWTKIDSSYDKKNNFKGVVYEKDGKYVVCFVGTDRWSAKDYAANFKMAVSGESRQMKAAQDFYNEKRNIYNLTPENTTIAGHSEGGTEGTYVGIRYNIPTVTYNAFGISKKLVDKNKNYDSLVTNYCDSHDPVSKLKGNVGRTFIIENTQNAFMTSTPFGSLPAHGIKNLGDCNDAVPVEEYKKKNPFFLSKISEAAITRETISAMPSDLYGVYEGEIDERMKNNQIPSNGEANQRVMSGDMVYVNSYTRDDGTKVSGYYRQL